MSSQRSHPSGIETRCHPVPVENSERTEAIEVAVRVWIGCDDAVRVVARFRTVLLSRRSRAALHAKIIFALRHQLHVLERSRAQRIRLTPADRALRVALSCVWSGWRAASILMKPARVVAWHRRGFRLVWQWKSRRRAGRPGVSTELRTLIQSGLSEGESVKGGVTTRLRGQSIRTLPQSDETLRLSGGAVGW